MEELPKLPTDKSLTTTSLRSEHGNSEIATQTLTFLDLPTEVRLQVYGYLSTFINAESANSVKQRRERSQVLTTRYSLQLVCRQITTEWSPLFYATTTIVANGVSRLNEMTREFGKRSFSGPEPFIDFFRANCHGHLFTTVRRISYEEKGDNWLRSTSWIGSGYLAAYLRKDIAYFPRLEEIEFRAKLYNSCIAQKNDATSLKRLWSQLSDVCKIVTPLTSGGGGSDDWTVARRMRFRDPQILGIRHYGVDGAMLQVLLRKAGLPLLGYSDGWWVVS